MPTKIRYRGTYRLRRSLIFGVCLVLLISGTTQSAPNLPDNLVITQLTTETSQLKPTDAVIHHGNIQAAGDVSASTVPSNYRVATGAQATSDSHYVDGSAAMSAEKGTASEPFQELMDAVNTVLPGGNIIVAPGTYRAVGIWSKAMTLRASAGDVTIGFSADTDNDGLSDDFEQALAEMYRPIMIFDKDETRWPTSARWFAQHSHLRIEDGKPIYTQPQLEQDPTLVLRAHEAGYAFSDLRRASYSTSFHIDLDQHYAPRDPTFHGEGAIPGTKGQPDEVRLPTIPIYVVVHRLTQDVEPHAALDTTGMYRLHYFYGFSYNAVSFGNHEGDWERLEAYVDSRVDPYNNTPQHRARMLQGINHYAHCASRTVLTLPSDHVYFPNDGIPRAYVETGQHGFFRWTDPGRTCGNPIPRDVDGDGLRYRVQNVVNLGENGLRIIRLGENIEKIEDRNIALFFSGVFGEGKPLFGGGLTGSGVPGPGRRMPLPDR